MTVLSGAGIVLPDRVLSPGTLVIDGDRIVDIRPGAVETHAGNALHGHYLVPGFVDLHVHGVEGVDSLHDGDAVASIAARLPRYGVTAFCPTTVACSPEALGRVLAQVKRARETVVPGAARVLRAHLESNFINPEYRGAQPAACLRSPRAALEAWAPHIRFPERAVEDPFDAASILHVIEQAGPEVGIVTLAPELDGGLALIAWLVSRGHRVSLGHSAATYDQARSAIAAGARHATHLFNRMPPLGHRSPGLAGAVLESDDVAAEIICDGVHVHPALVRTTVATKRPSRVCAITDGTAASGLAAGSMTSLGSEPIRAGENAAFRPDGTLAGSVLTMDGAFRMLVERAGVSLVDAATMCAATPARELALADQGVLAVGGIADLVVLDRRLSVVRTYVAGRVAYARA